VAGGHLLLLVTRTERWFFLPPFPAAALFTAILLTQILAVLMCGFGWLVPPIPWSLIGWVWVYNIAWMFVLGGVRLLTERFAGVSADRGVSLNVAFEAESLSLQTQIVSEGGIYALLGPYAVAAAARERSLRSAKLVAPVVTRHIALAMSRHGSLTLACRTVMQLARDIAKSGAAGLHPHEPLCPNWHIDCLEYGRELTSPVAAEPKSTCCPEAAGISTAGGTWCRSRRSPRYCPSQGSTAHRDIQCAAARLLR
jgi:hypothetical protein